MIFPRIEKAIAYRKVFWDLSIKQVKARYSGSMLGLWWAVITPMILALSINFVFTHVFGAPSKNYVFFLLAGLIPWTFFSSALSEATNSFAVHASILKQGIFPREYVPLSAVFSNFLVFGIGLLFLLPLFIISNPAVGAMLPLLLIAFLSQLALLAGLGLIFSILNVFYRDVSHLLSSGLMIWFWVTPVFYSLDMVGPPYRRLLGLNPLTYLMSLYQSVLFKAEVPSCAVTGVSLAVGFFFLVLGIYLFVKCEPALLKRI